MNLVFLASLLEDLGAVITENDDNSHGLINAAKGFEFRARSVLGDHPRCGEVAGHLNRGSASPAYSTLKEIQAAAQNATTLAAK